MSERAAKTATAGVPFPRVALVALLLGLGCGGSGSSFNGATGGHGGSGTGHGGAGGQPHGGAGGRSGIGGAAGGRGTGGAGGTAANTGGMSGGFGGAMGTGGFGGAGPGCSLSIAAIAPSSFTIEAGPGVTMRVQGSASGTFAALTWTWTVTYSDGNNTRIPTQTKDLDGAPPGTVVEFPVENVGLYQIAASVTGDPRCTMTTRVLTATASAGPSFTFRTTASGYPVQETRIRLSDGPVRTLLLDKGQPVAVDPVDPTYFLLLPSYVRISSPSTSFDIEGDTTRTPFAPLLLPSLTYDVLIVPDGDFAPLLVALNPMTGSMSPTVVDPGLAVLTHTLAFDGSPVASARMLLRRGTVPSTVGTSDASGALTVLARAGGLSATIVPPDGSGLPVATTADDAFDLAMTALPTLTMQWDELPVGTLTVQVRGPDGVVPVGNAQVWLSSAGAPYRAGTLTVGDALALDTVGSVTSSATTGDDGSATFPPYPVGDYALIILPPSSAAPAALTTMPVTLQGGATLQTVTLASKVPLSGTLRPLPGGAGALIQAVDAGTPPTGFVVAAQAGSDGTFSLLVDPDRTYELIVKPLAGASSTLARAVLTVSTNGQGRELGSITLPPGLSFQGTVRNDDTTMSNAFPIENAFVQVYCVTSSASCVDPTVSLAEATTLGDGTFTVVLPQSVATSSATSP